jgi:hypothetical protein
VKNRLQPATPPVRGQYDTGFFVQRWRTVNVTGRHCVKNRLRPAAPPVRGQYDTGFFVQRWRTVNVTGRHCVKNRQPRRVRLPVLFLQCCFAPVCAPGCLEWSG